MHSIWRDLAWNCCTVFIGNLYQSFGPLFTPKVPFRSTSWEPIGRISTNSIYTFILARSSLDCYTSFIAHCIIVMAYHLRQNFVSAQYLENLLTNFHQILYMHGYWQDLAWDFYMLFFSYFYKSYGPWFATIFCFCSISCDPISRISQNLLTHSSWHLFKCYRYCGNKNGQQYRLKIEKLPFWAKFQAFWDRFKKI